MIYMNKKTKKQYIGTRASEEEKSMLLALSRHYERTPADTIRYLIKKDYREVFGKESKVK